MSLETLGWICLVWTAIEVTRLIVRARRTARFRDKTARTFGAWDQHGEAIDIDFVN